MTLVKLITEFHCTFPHISDHTETFNGSYDNLCTIKWFDFCLSKTLRVIFMWLINGEKWIMTGESSLIYIGLFEYRAIAAYCLTRLRNQ